MRWEWQQHCVGRKISTATRIVRTIVGGNLPFECTDSCGELVLQDVIDMAEEAYGIASSEYAQILAAFLKECANFSMMYLNESTFPPLGSHHHCVALLLLLWRFTHDG